MTSPPQSAQPGAKKPGIESPPRPSNSNTQRVPLSLHTWVSAWVCVTGFIGLTPHIIEPFLQRVLFNRAKMQSAKSKGGLGVRVTACNGQTIGGGCQMASLQAVGWVRCIAYSPGLKSPQRAAGSPGPWHFFPFLMLLE